MAEKAEPPRNPDRRARIGLCYPSPRREQGCLRANPDSSGDKIMARYILMALLGTIAFRPELDAGAFLDEVAPKIVMIAQTALGKSECLFRGEAPE